MSDKKHQITLTVEEQKAIKSLQRLAKKWPKSITLFSWSGSLVVFKEVDGKLGVVDTIRGIPNDGGDPNYGQELWDDHTIDIIKE